ncbi:alpha/beta fold hydrolase [uncultured Gimesia sp.]|uniref:alpha/beta fold hydrolase n=1 Tax=uncultured Gimesia sp. TaxID=1678688 RepID=UPI0030DD1793|tara:strand:+ start:27458 stop:28330 length:873 start_codon:yes stop_codon:yes gene_type:complete
MGDPAIEEFVASDNYRLQGRVWTPEETQPRGTLVVLHGIQSHSGWYDYSCSQLCDAGFRVCFFDRRGSGLNQNERGHVSHWQRLVQDVVQLLTQIRYQQQSKQQRPIILQAMSWGGKLAVVVAALRPDLIDGLALLYPGIKAVVKPTGLQKFQLKLAKQLGVERKRVEIPLNDPALFTGEAAYQDFIRTDSLALRDVTVSFLQANRELDRLADSAAGQISCPTLCQLAGRDQIIDNAATEVYFQRIAADQKQLVQYPEARHTLEFEPNRDQIVADYVDWLADLNSSHPIS